MCGGDRGSVSIVNCPELSSSGQFAVTERAHGLLGSSSGFATHCMIILDKLFYSSDP